MPLALFTGGIGYAEVLIVLAIALIIFGRKLPGVARSLGKSILEFKKGLKDVETDIEAEPESESKSDAAQTDTEAEPESESKNDEAQADSSPTPDDSNTEKQE